MVKSGTKVTLFTKGEGMRNPFSLYKKKRKLAHFGMSAFGMKKQENIPNHDQPA
jgi:hypothetical protein